MADLAFGEWLKRRRRALGLTQDELARQINCSTSALRKIEGGIRRPSEQIVEQLAEVFNIVPSERLSFLRFARGQQQAAPVPLMVDTPWHSTDINQRSNLPASISSFIGREKEQKEIAELIARSRLVVLTGAGGIGKSRLAIQTASTLSDELPNGTWLVELASLSDPALIPQVIVTMLGLSEQADRSPLAVLTDHLQAKRALLILDNCEHLIQGCAQLAEGLLRACPNLHILVTSREALGIDGEALYVIPPLSIPDRLHDTLDALLYYEGVQLFVERAQAALPGFSLTHDNAAAVVRVCYQLEGIPLALELAAARVRLLRVEEIAARLDDRFYLLTTGAHTVPPRHQTLRGMIDWSHDLLSEPERALLRRLSIFAGGWILEAAEAVCGSTDEGEAMKYEVHASDILELLARLVNKSLVLAKRNPGHRTRYRMLETIRQYAHEKLEAAGEGETLRHRHLVYFVDLAEQAEPNLRGPEMMIWLDRLEAEYDNIRAALEWGSSIGIANMGFRLAGALWRFWFQGGHFSEGQQWLERAGSQKDAPPAVRAKAVAGAGFLANFRGDTARVLILCTESLQLAHEVGNPWLAAFSLNLLGESYLQNGDYAPAQASLEECLVLARHTGDPWLIAFSLAQMVELAQQQHDSDQAAAFAEESLALARGVGDPWLIAFALFRLGNVSIDRHEYGVARAMHEESLTIRRKMGDRLGAAYALLGLANTAWAQGDRATAWVRMEERLALERELNNKLGAAHALGDLGWLAFEREDYTRAEMCFEQSLAICRELANHWCVAFQLCSLARVALASKDYGQATTRLQEGLMLARAQDLKGYIIPLLTRNLGNVDYCQADYASAWANYTKSLTGYQEIQDAEGIVENLIVLGCLAISWQAQPRKAARLWGAADVIGNIENAFIDRRERLDYENAVGVAHVALGEDAFAVAWGEGKRMTLDEVVTYALIKE